LSVEPGNRGIVQRFGGETGYFVKGRVPQAGDSCILYPADGSDIPVCIPFASIDINDFVFLMPDFNFDFLVQLPSYESYSPPPTYRYSDFKMWVSERNAWIYGDSGEPYVTLKTDGSGFANPTALFAFLFEDSGSGVPPRDCYIDVRMIDNAYFEIWAGPAHSGFLYTNYLYYKSTLLTSGTGTTMPTVHVVLPI
jgi:hypothetical protein